MLSPSYISLSTGCAKPPGPFHGTVDLLLLLPTHLTSGARQDLEAAMTSIGATSVSEYELDQQAGVLASALLDLGSAISQIEAVAAAFQHRDPWFWGRVKAAVEYQTCQLLFDNTQGSEEAWKGAMSSWIWPAINARVPPPAGAVDFNGMENDIIGELGFESNFDSGGFFYPLSLPSDTAYALPPPQGDQSPPGVEPAFSYTSSLPHSPSPNLIPYLPDGVMTSFPSSSFDTAPLTSLDPQLLTSSSPPAPLPINTSFSTLPTTNPSESSASSIPCRNVLVQTAYATLNEAPSPWGAKALFAGGGNNEYSTTGGIAPSGAGPSSHTLPHPPSAAASLVEPSPVVRAGRGRSKSCASASPSSRGCPTLSRSVTDPSTSRSAPTYSPYSRPRAKSDMTVKGREKRKLNIATDAVFCDNESDVWVIYAPSRGDKVHITPNDLHEVVLDRLANQPGSSLHDVAFNHVAYTPELHAIDCERGQAYIFTSNSSKKSGRYRVSFSLAHPDGVVQLVDPSDGVSLIEPRLPMTFIHFPRTSIVVFPAHPIGSANWWRLPRCVGNHLKPDEPDGSWTGRWDVEDPRRPSRCVEHWADCEHRKQSGDGWDDPIGRLARAIRAPLGGVKRIRRKSAVQYDDSGD